MCIPATQPCKETTALDDVARNLAAVRARIADAARDTGRDPASVRLLAVSKGQPTTAIEAAWRAGQTEFAENYLQEALAKQRALADRGLIWHFIGPLQSNKTRDVARHFHWVHTVDRERIARRLSEQRPPDLPPLDVCLQVNVSGESTKAGVTPDSLPALAAAVAALPRLRLRGLMAIPAPTPVESEQRAAFHRLCALLSRLNASGLALDTLSMGMSGDLEAAIHEGATMVRIGTAIFGERPRPPRTA